MGEPSECPAKRVKMDQAQTTGKPAKNKSKYQDKNRNRKLATVSASGIHNNDVGIFVTSDKGQEKKCLQELVDLLGELLEQDDDTSAERVGDTRNTGSDDDFDIEADIEAELDSLTTKQNPPNGHSQNLSLVELDIPCVSFVRFPSSSKPHDPVEVVRRLCTSAADKDYRGPRSRYIKRLTPITLIRKSMGDGLDVLCNEILPAHFRLQGHSLTDEFSETNTQNDLASCKFAIRPTVRNNHKIDRDHIIRVVADKIEVLGQGKHKVDLKGYDKLVLVDVYRNVVGMSVVGNEFEIFKRFNLAEIHSSHFDDANKKSTQETANP